MGIARLLNLISSIRNLEVLFFIGTQKTTFYGRGHRLTCSRAESFQGRTAVQWLFSGVYVRRWLVESKRRKCKCARRKLFVQQDRSNMRATKGGFYYVMAFQF